MTWILGIGLLAIIAAHLTSLFMRGDIPGLVRSLRWIVAGALGLFAGLSALRGQIGIAMFTAIIAVTLLRQGRLGPIDFTTFGTAPGATSRVRSRYFAMQLDHDSQDMTGKVIAGSFKGANLIDIGEHDMLDLLAEVRHDADSLALLESWLDANRAGWREYFGMAYGAGSRSNSGGSAAASMTEHEALEMLGLPAGASAEDIKAAHRRLLKAVHPDHGGSDFLAARVNAAKDFLLKQP